MASHLKKEYALLGLEEGADLQEIKKAYRVIALKYHPDQNQGDLASAEIFKTATAAYRILTSSNGHGQTHTTPQKDIKSDTSFANHLTNFAAKLKKDIAPTYSPPRYTSSQFDDTLRSYAFRNASVDGLKEEKPLFVKPLKIEEKLKKGIKEDLETLIEFPKDILAFSYAQRLFGKVMRKDVEGFIPQILPTLEQASSLEKMVQTGNTALSVLNHGNVYWDEKRRYFPDIFKNLFSALLARYEQEEALEDITTLIKTCDAYVAHDLPLLAFAEEHARIITTVLTTTLPSPQISKIVEKLQKIAYPNHVYGKRDWDKRLHPFFETTNYLLAEKNYTLEPLLNILDIISVIKKNNYVSFPYVHIKPLADFFKGLGTKLHPEEVEPALEVTKLLACASRGYKNGSIKNYAPMQEWYDSFEEVLPLYTKDQARFLEAIFTFQELKYNSEEKIEWWPGVFHVPVITASFGIKKLFATSENYENPKQAVVDFRTFLAGYRKSYYVSKKKSIDPPEKPLTTEQQEAYFLLKTIQKGRKGISSSKKVLSEDLSTIIDIYFKTYLPNSVGPTTD